jgi:hypothetical protein
MSAQVPPDPIDGRTKVASIDIAIGNAKPVGKGTICKIRKTLLGSLRTETAVRIQYFSAEKAEQALPLFCAALIECG